MNKNFVNSHKKVIEATLLVGVVLGGIAATIVAAAPYLGLLLMKYVDGAPDTTTIEDQLAKVALSVLPVTPFMLFLSSISAVLHTIWFSDKENKWFLRIWSVAMLLILIRVLADPRM